MKQAEDKIGANMLHVEGIFFEIQGSELKPDPSEIASQATKICKTHSAFFFGISEHSLDGFLVAFIKVTQRRSVPVVLDKLKIVCPDVLFNGFDTLSVFGTLEFEGAVFANVEIVFELTVAFASSCRILQNAVFETKSTVEILIIGKLIWSEKAIFAHWMLV